MTYQFGLAFSFWIALTLKSTHSSNFLLVLFYLGEESVI